ncbi:MAG: Rne/Rng family ribonuclease [Candidatus Neomarinimicrobiota bacterium]
MGKEIHISETAGERRIAVLEDGELVEIYVEKLRAQDIVSNIYKGKVENVIPGMRAAFVDIGYDINSFLPFSEITNPEYLKDTSTSEEEDERGNGDSTTEGEMDVDLETGQEILVQVIKEPFSGKGPRVTTNIAIPGHLLVMVPNAQFVGISKKIWDKYEKRRLRKIARNLLPKGMGIIVRTEAEGKDEQVIRKDFEILMQNWKTLDEKSRHMAAPSLIYEDLEAVSTVIRDLLTSDIARIVFDSRKLYRRIQGYLQDVSPSLVSKLEIHRGRVPLFTKGGIEEKIDKSLRRRVWVKSGAYLVIEHTEAMAVVDVNSGRFIGKGHHEENSLTINLEAAREVARQLRLRDIGGLIVIDFIDMQDENNKKKVYDELRKELRKDRAKVAVSPISDFGLLEMTRQRVRLSLLDSVTEKCPTCHGSGRIGSKDSVITKIDNWLRGFRNKNRGLRLRLRVHPTLADYLRDSKKDVLRKFMWHNFVHIDIEEDKSLGPDEFQFYSRKKGEEITHKV